MTEEKKRRFAVPLVACMVFFLTVLFVVVAAQIVILCRKEAELANLNEQKAILKQLNEEKENSIEEWNQEWKVEEAARYLGYVNSPK